MFLILKHKMTILKFISKTLVVCIPLLILGCTKKQESEKCISFKQSPVTKVDGPTAGNVNQEINLNVSFNCFNGCGQFGYIEESSNDYVTTIKVIAKYEGCMCPQNVPTLQTIYKFKAKKTGVHLIKFLQSDNIYLTDTIVIQ